MISLDGNKSEVNDSKDNSEQHKDSREEWDAFDWLIEDQLLGIFPGTYEPSVEEIKNP